MWESTGGTTECCCGHRRSTLPELLVSQQTLGNDSSSTFGTVDSRRGKYSHSFVGKFFFFGSLFLATGSLKLSLPLFPYHMFTDFYSFFIFIFFVPKIVYFFIIENKITKSHDSFS